MSDNIWTTCTLGDQSVAIISSGGTPSRSRPDYFGGDIQWVKSGDLKDRPLAATEETISQEGLENSATKLLPKNTVLIAMYGATVGRTALLKTEATTNQAVCAIQPNPDVFNPHFLQFMLMYIRPQLLRERYGGAQPNISQTVIRNLELPRPERAEQDKISAVLWKVQRAIEIEEKVIGTARELKQSAMRQLFTSGLRGEPQKETEIGLLPESWNPMLLDDCCDVVNSSLSYTDFERMSETTDETAVLAMGIKVSDMNLSGNESQMLRANLRKRISPELAQKKLVPTGAVVFPKRGAAIATNKKRMTTAWTVLDPNLIGVHAGEGVNPSFLFYWFQNFDLRTITEPGPTPQLNKKNLTPLLLPIPKDPKEQEEISGLLEIIDRKISIHERKRATLQELFKTLLHQLMTGEIRVDKLDIDTSEVVESEGEIP